MTRVLVLSGGSSSEREVSLRSGASVQKALMAAGHDVGTYDPADTSQSLAAAAEGYDVVFPALHGAGGEDGVIQQELEYLGLPYVGSDVRSSELCFDKWNYRALLQSQGLPVAKGELVDRETFSSSSLTAQPYVLKPPRGGSSVDTILAHDVDTVSPSAIDETFGRHPQLLLESLCFGTEITVAVLEHDGLPVIEIIPPSGKDFDYENKYNGATQELCPPLHVSEDIQTQARDLAVRIHKLCGCRDLSRTDMIVAEDGSLTVLETNTIPGLTDQSLFPKSAAAAGLSMPELCDKLVRIALSPTRASG